MKTSKMLDGYPQRSCARPSFAPLCRDRLKPPIGRFALPPLRRTYQAPIGAALPRRYARSSLRFASLGIRDARALSTRHRFRPLAARCATRDTAPAPATAPPLARLGAACARGWAPRRRHPDTLRGRDPRLGSGLNSLAFARSPLPRPRASAKRSAGFFAAFCRALLAA